VHWNEHLHKNGPRGQRRERHGHQELRGVHKVEGDGKSPRSDFCRGRLPSLACPRGGSRVSRESRMASGGLIMILQERWS
jgi:hypothetical protein